MTAATGAPLAPDTVGVGCTFEAQLTQHVFYQGVDNHIHELWWDSKGWHHNDVTAAAGAPLSLFGPETGYVFFTQATQHVFYQRQINGATDDHIHELWWDSHGWHDNDVTAAVGVPTIKVGNLTSYDSPAQVRSMSSSRQVPVKGLTGTSLSCGGTPTGGIMTT